MEEKDLKPNRQEQAVAVAKMLNSDGWKIIEHWAYEQFETLRMQLESSSPEQIKYFQGQIATFRQLFLKLKGYKDAVKKGE